MDPFPLLDLISTVLGFILIVVFFWRVSKLKPPQVFFLLDFVCYKSPFIKPDPTQVLENQPVIYTSPNEVENVVWEMVDELLKRAEVKVKDIGVLVCVFNGSSTISLSSMIAKRYELNEDIVSYDLNGKGCNSGLMAITLAKQLLQAKFDCCALVLSTEQLPEGRHVSTYSLPPEYRPSGAAILLSNRTSDSQYAKYKLIGTHNVHLALPDRPSSDPGTQDVHVTFTDDATSASEKVMRSNAAFVSPLVRSCPHWFSHCQVSGEPMVGAVERNPNLLPSYNRGDTRVVSWFGYEPVTCLWYKLAQMETNDRRFGKGDLVSQTALWSDWLDFKGSSLVWQAIGDVDRREKKTKPMVFKLSGDVNFRQFLPRI